MPETHSAESFVDIAKDMTPSLHPGMKYQNDFMAGPAMGNGGEGMEDHSIPDADEDTKYSDAPTGNSDNKSVGAYGKGI